MIPTSFIHLFANCIISQGYSRSAIFDLQRNRYWFISNEWANVLKKGSGINEAHLSENLPKLSTQDITSFLTFLEAEELIYRTSKDCSKQFPPLSQKHQSPNLIQTVSVDVASSRPLIQIEEIDFLLVDYLILYFTDNIDPTTYLSHYKNSRLKGIDIVLSYALACTLNLEEIIDQELRVHNILITNHPESFSKTYKNSIFKSISTPSNKQHTFRINQELYIESQHYNTYYNQRLHIDKNGYVSNTKETTPIGNKQETSFAELIQIPDLKRLWGITKNQIDVCKDCEFKPICVDKRPLKRRGNKAWFSAEECSYNPYICMEKGQEGFRSLQDCGIKSNSRGFGIEVETFIRIKDHIWGKSN